MIWVLLQSGSPWNVMTPLRFLFIFVFLCTRSSFKKSLKGVYLPKLPQLWQSWNKFYERVLEIF